MIIIYTVEKIVEKVLYSNSTNFVEIKYLSRVKKELKNVKYNIYEPFSGATKVILYNKMPNIKIYEILSMPWKQEPSLAADYPKMTNP